MVQFGAIRSRLAAINNRELTGNLGHFEADRAIFSRGNHRYFKWLDGNPVLCQNLDDHLRHVAHGCFRHQVLVAAA